ncbi:MULTISPECIES: hypothetical protein [unclassified Pseudomonas]|uniref:hypothetical protein n=1 Tax=unclassified Pseudomonas TaxID=196821 RepID=UPI00385ED99E
MKSWLYPQTVEAVEHACMLYMRGDLQTTDLQAALYKAENEIVAYEEQWLRSLLCDTENSIEEIVFTEASESQAASVKLLILNLLEKIK